MTNSCEKIIEHLYEATDNRVIGVNEELGPICSIPAIWLYDAAATLKTQQDIINEYKKADTFLAVHGWTWNKKGEE